MFRRYVLIVMIAISVEAQSAPRTTPGPFRITGTVVDALRGDALEDIDVSIALSQSETLLQTVTTGADGRFEFAGLAAAKYALSAGGRGYLQQGYEQHHAFFTAIVTGPEHVSENLTFKLKPESAISGIVTDDFNDPIEGEVLLFITDPTENPQAVTLRRRYHTNDSGEFEIGHLQPGTYYLAVVAHPWYARTEPEEDSEDVSPAVNPPVEDAGSAKTAVSEEHHHSQLDVAFQTTYYTNATDPGQATPISLRPGEHAQVELRLFAVPTLRVKVRTTANSGNAPDTVKLMESMFSYRREVASEGLGPDGAEMNGLAPGHYSVEYTGQSGSQPIQQALDLAADSEIAPGEGSRIASTVSGKILLGGKDPCLRCTIRLISLPSWERFDARNTDKGFQIEGGVRPGRYFVLVLNQEKYLIRDIAATGAKLIGTDLEIPSGANVHLVVAMTKDVSMIHGVALRDGKPASQSAVFLVPKDPARKRMLFRRDQSDSDGTFAFRSVLPGEYTAVAVSEGWDLEWTNPAVLRTYLGGGTKIRVEGTGTHQIQVAEQPLGGTRK